MCFCVNNNDACFLAKRLLGRLLFFSYVLSCCGNYYHFSAGIVLRFEHPAIFFSTIAVGWNCNVELAGMFHAWLVCSTLGMFHI